MPKNPLQKLNEGLSENPTLKGDFLPLSYLETATPQRSRKARKQNNSFLTTLKALNTLHNFTHTLRGNPNLVHPFEAEYEPLETQTLQDPTQIASTINRIREFQETQMVNTILNTNEILPHILAYNKIKHTPPNPIVTDLLTKMNHRKTTKIGAINTRVLATTPSPLSPLCEPSLIATNTGTTRALAKNLIDFQRTCKGQKGLKLDKRYLSLAHKIEGNLESMDTAFDTKNEVTSF